MKRILLAASCALPMMAFGQVLLYNDGAMLKVQPGATLFVEGGIQNTASGTIDNDGTIELQGNFINAGTWNPDQPNILKFSGTGNSDVTPGSAVFQSIVVQKGSGANVNLLGQMTIQTNLDFNGTNCKLSLGNHHLRLAGATTVTGYDSDEYIMTGGTGLVKKHFTGTGAFEFPVGFNSTTYNPADINLTAGPADTMRVRVLGSPTDGNGLTGTPITTDVVDAVWDISEHTIGGNTASLTLSWTDVSDELPGFNDALNTVSYNDGTNGWDGLFPNYGPENPADKRTRTGITSFGAFAVGGKILANDIVIDAKVFLAGPYDPATDLMRDDVRAAGWLPLIEMYTNPPAPAAGNAALTPYIHVGFGGAETVSGTSIFDQAGTNNDAVDWIILELRDASNPATRVATRTALLQRDGDIVEVDNVSPVVFRGLADGTYHLAIKHRNHLSIRTDVAESFSSTLNVLNFKVDNFAYDNGSSINEPTATVEAGVEAMWAGDVNSGGTVTYGALSDRVSVLNRVGQTTPLASIPGYFWEDANMSGNTTYGALSDRIIILNTVGQTTPLAVITAHQ